MIEVIVYGKDNCADCTTAANLIEKIRLKTSSITCVYKKLGTDFTREELLEKFPNAKTFPQITANDEIITLDQLKITVGNIL